MLASELKNKLEKLIANKGDAEIYIDEIDDFVLFEMPVDDIQICNGNSKLGKYYKITS